MERPLFASLSLIGRCNSRCVYCGAWQSPLPGPSTAAWLKVIDQVAALGVCWLNLSGGEPLLRDDLPALVAAARSRGLMTQLSTNGLQLAGERFAQCTAAGLNYVTVSLDTLNPERFQQLRGVPLAAVLRGLDAALALQRRLRNLRVGLKCVVSRLNLGDLLTLAEFARERGLYLGFQPFHPQFAGDPATVAGLRLLAEDTAYIAECVGRLIEWKQEGENIIINDAAYLRNLPGFLTQGTLPAGFSCPAGDLTVNVDVNLHLKPCWTFPAVGSLADQSLDMLWSSAPMEQIRAKMRALECSGCWLTCHTDLEWGANW